MGLLDNLTADEAVSAAQALAPLADLLAPPVGPALSVALGLVGDIVGFVEEGKRDAALEAIRVQLRAGVFNTIERELESKFPNG